MKPIMRDEENSIFKDTNHELEMFHVRKELQRRKGKVIVLTIATVNIVLTVISFLMSFDFIMLIAQITWSVLLYKGFSWVRYIVGIGAVLAAFLSGLFVILYIFTPNGAKEDYFIIVFYSIYFVYSLTSAILLLGSECVEEFLYNQKEDRNSI